MIYDYIRWYEWLFYHVRLNCSVQSLSRVWLFASPWTAAHQASLSITNSRSPPKFMSIELVMPCSHLILCCPLLLLHSIFPSIRVFSSESALCIRWPRYWSIPYLHLFSKVYFSGFDTVIFDTVIILFLNLFCRFSELTYWWPNNSHPVFLDEFNGIWTRMEIL